ncbi:MAG: C10 family peptidase [Muribaculaceae bacterium]|nr:C10 family peptidase [Muribaculaceae bacterium]
MRIVNFLKSLMLVMLVCTTANMTAANVDANAAMGKAVQFLNAQPGSRFMASPSSMQLAYTEVSKVNAAAADYYVFNAKDGGAFVIVAGDDRAEEILGYGDKALDMDRIPSNMKWWLDQYKRQMEYLYANPKLEVVTPSKLMAGKVTLSVSPLMTSKWDQEAPYYNQCPTRNGSYCLTGCVATAMAQVMYYWKYPAQLPALSGYTTSTRRIQVSALPGTTVDWANMLDTYTSGNYTTAQGNAVATLMRYCGQSCIMDYDTSSGGGSGAYCEDQLTGMQTFGYNSGATCIDRDNYSASAWNTMMQADLEAGRPILYAGDDNWAGGHAFVVDGWNGSKYHVNWGWSGDGDGYFALDAFSVDGYTFSSYQQMLYQIYPEGTAIETYAPVMADASNVGTNSFKAVWTDQTDNDNVTDYTLYVQAYDPNSETLLTETFGGVTATSDGSTRIESSLDQYCDNAGWTGSYVYQAGGGGLKLGNSSNGGSVTTPALDMSTSGGTITVKINAKTYNTDATVLTISCGNASQTVTLTGTATDYTVVLSGVTAAAGQKVTIASNGSRKRWYLYNVEITTGDNSAKLTASETGDANSRVITGITAKNYTVSNLTAGGSYKFYVVANYTDGTSKQSNVKTVTLEGSVVPTPELIAYPETLTMTANVGETSTCTFDILGADLEGNVTLTLNDDNGVYSINPTTISKANAENGATVTVTYAPTATGAHPATVTIASAGAEAVTVTINGTAAMQTNAPVMAAATNVTTTSFTATWTDATSAAYVQDYTLYVNKVGDNSNLLLSEAFSGVTAANDGTTRIETSLDDYCDNAGWTGSYIYQAGGGGLKFGNSSNGGTLISPVLDLTNCGGSITVALNAKNYGTDITTLTVSCGEASQTVTLTDAAADYTVVLNGVTATAGQQVTISSTGSRQRYYLYSVNIYNGATLKAVSETGDENSRVITGITAKNYTVQNLTPGATYKFYVVANYIDGTNANSNTEQVTLENTVVPTPELIVDPETLVMNANVGETVTATFDVLGADLTGNVTVTLTDESGMFTITPATVSIADAEEGATVTVTYAPTAAGTHTATITVGSEGAEDVAVTVTGTAAMPLGELVMLPADENYITTTSFRADWSDETNAAYVTDYTLYVNKVGQSSELLLSEAFGGVTAQNDGTSRIETSLDEYCDNAGWTGSYIYQAGGGGLKFGNSSNGGTLISPALDLTTCGGTVTVRFNAKNFGTDATTLTVSCGDVSESVELTSEAADYTVVLSGVTAAADQQVTLSSTGSRQRWYLYSVQIYSGETTAKAVVETGDENSRVITGITGKYYVVEGLTEGATYNYYVVANYIDGTDATSNTETVTLLENQGHGYNIGDVNHDGSVTIADVTALIDYLLGSNDNACVICADVNGDQGVSIADVTALIDVLLGNN